MQYTGIKSIDDRINEKIEKARSRKYFLPRELEECNKLIPEVEKAVDEHKEALRPWYKTTHYDAGDALGAALKAAWIAARGAAPKAAFYVARNAGREAAWRAAWDAAWDAALKATREAAPHAAWVACDAARDVALDVGWETIRDVKGYENNPFEEVVKIYDMGLYPKGFRLVDGEERFIVDFPLLTRELGCWAEGDGKILYKHKWTEDCKKVKPIKPLRVIEEIFV
ncbi:MAG: hypothetical protein ACP5O8_03780 [Candidatus Aenigmatarchaeota archaeon]